MGCIYYDTKYNKISNLLKLEGWSLIYKNKKYLYYNKYTNKEQENYPNSISDYNDIYDFYNIDVLSSYYAIEYLKKYYINNATTLTSYEKEKINNYIYTIKNENDIDEENISLLRLCIN